MATEEYGKGRPGDVVDIWFTIKDDIFVMEFGAKISSLKLTREEAYDLANRMLRVLSEESKDEETVQTGRALLGD